MTTKIEWTDVSVNPFPGCMKISPGCLHCYAERRAKLLRGNGHPAYQDVVDAKGWTGKVGCQAEDVMKVPGKGKMVFVNSMGDLAYDEVPFPGFVNCLGHMMLQPWHTFQTLTKRPAEFAERLDRIIDIGTKARYLDPLMLMVDSVSKDFTEEEFAKAHAWHETHSDQSGRGVCDLPIKWPLRNLWAGTTCENQGWYDKRAQDSVEIRAAVHFLSLEPLIGPIEIHWPKSRKVKGEFFAKRESLGIDWVIVGTETGPGRRPADLRWFEPIIKACHAAKVPVFVKSLNVNGTIIKDIESISSVLGETPESVRQWPEENPCAR